SAGLTASRLVWSGTRFRGGDFDAMATRFERLDECVHLVIELTVVARGDDDVDPDRPVPSPQLFELLGRKRLLRHQVEDLRVLAGGLHGCHLTDERLPR